MFIQIGYEEHFHLPAFDSFEEFVEELNDLLGEDTYLIENNGKKIDLTSDYQLVDDGVYKIWPKVLGGKGGFGSLLRSFGKQILISKNKEACRDLNGRRMRDVNNEKRLKVCVYPSIEGHIDYHAQLGFITEWMQKQLEKPATSSSDGKKKASTSHEAEPDYRNVAPPSELTETPYKEQKKQISDDMDEAVRVAAELIRAEKSKKKSATAVSTNDPKEESTTTKAKKRRHSDDTLEEGELTNKKGKGANAAFFVGIDLDDVSSDDDEEEEEMDAKKKKK